MTGEQDWREAVVLARAMVADPAVPEETRLKLRFCLDQLDASIMGIRELATVTESEES